MGKTPSTIIGLILALVLASGGYVLFLSWVGGEFREVTTIHPQHCERVPGLPGSEDITIHPSGAYAYISSDDRRSILTAAPVPGAIYRYSLLDDLTAPVNLTPDAGIGFRPHGISLFSDASGRSTLFVISHPQQLAEGRPGNDSSPFPHSIIIYDVINGELEYRRTVTGALLSSPNDLVAVDHESFYVSNDNSLGAGLLSTLEAYLRLPWTNIVYFDGNELRVAAEGLSFANGINVSPDGEHLYVAEVSHSRVKEYARNERSGDLTYRRTLYFDFGVDNIEVDPGTGDLYVGGHVKLLTFVRHSADASVLSPSQAVRVELSDNDYAVTTLFMDDGSLLSGASVAAWHNGRLLIGSVFEPHILSCRM